MSKHKVNRQLMMGENGDKKKGVEAPKWIEWTQKESKKQDMSERSHCFQKTSGGVLLREVRQLRILAIIYFLLMALIISMPEARGGAVIC